MYAETDFYLALIKPNDWLGKRASKLYAEHKDQIWTSQLTSQEILLYSNKNKLNPIAVLSSFYEVANVIDIGLKHDYFLSVVHVMEKFKVTPFDAMHAIIAAHDGLIISSDSIYDKIGLKRIKLEE